MTEKAEGPGAALRSAREALHVSTREVSEALNLPLNVIEALEANDYEKLRQPVFTRGYLRSYARLLELDPDAIAARYSQPAAVATLPTAEFDAAATMPGKLPGIAPWMLAVAMVVALLLVVLLMVWLWPAGNEETDSAARSAAEETVAARLDEPADLGGASRTAPQIEAVATTLNAGDEPVAAAGQTEDEDTDNAIAAAIPDPTAASPDKVIPAQPAADTENVEDAGVISVSTPSGVRRLTPSGEDLLVLSFVNDCWVEIKDRDGNRLYGDLNRSGGTLRVIGRAPFRVLLGYAPGVEMTFNGDEIDVAANTRNNVASIMVGR